MINQNMETDKENVDESSEMDNFQNLSSSQNDMRFNSILKIIHLFHKSDTLEGKVKILRRLIRGLGATKNEVREGYYTSFTCLLRQLPKSEFEFDLICDLITKTLNPAGSSSKQESGEAYLGQTLAYSALLQTHYIDDKQDALERVASNLMDLSSKGSYLSSQCYELLCKFINKLDKEIITENFLLQLKAINCYTLDKLQYLMYLQNSFPTTTTVKEVFGSNKMLTKSNGPLLAELVMKSCHGYSSDHQFYESFCTKIAKKARFTQAFWLKFCEIVKEQLDKGGTPPSSIIETFLKICSNLLKQVVKQQLSSDYVNILIQDTVVIVLIDHGRKHHKMVQPLSDELIKILQESNDEVLKMNVIKKLINSPGNISFDKLSGSKIVSRITRMLKSEGVIGLASHFKDIVCNKGVPNKERLIACNHYNSLLSHPSCYEEVEWRLSGLKFLLNSGFIVDGNFSVEFAGLIRDVFYSQISNRFPSLPAYTIVLKELITCLHEGFLSKNLRQKSNPEFIDSWKHAMKLNKNIETYLNDHEDDTVRAIHVLSLYMSLILFKERDDSKVNLQDIGSVFSKIKKDPNESSEGPTWIEVLMDLFLNLLSKPCASHRHVIGCVFKNLAPHVNDQAFIQLLNVLNDTWSHKVLEDGRQAGEVTDYSSQSEDDSEEGEEDSNDENKLSKENLQMELQGILGPKDSDTSDIDVANIDPEEGIRIDSALAQAFKSSTRLKSNVQLTREISIMQFQMKVLDLIETVAKIGMDAGKWLNLIPSLVNLYKWAFTKKQEELKARLRNSFSTLTSTKLFKTSSSEERKEILALLHDLLAKASQASGPNTELCPQLLLLSTFIIKSLSGSREERGGINDVVAVVSHFMDEFFLIRKTHLPMDFFKGLCSSGWHGMNKLIKGIAEHIRDPKVSHHKRVEGIKLLKSYFKNARFFLSIDRELENNVKKCANLLLAYENLDEKHSHKYYLALWNMVLVFLKSKVSYCADIDTWKTIVQTEIYPARRGTINKQEMKRFKKMCETLKISEEMFSESNPQLLPHRSKDLEETKENLEVMDSESLDEGDGSHQKKTKKAAKRKRANVNKLKKESKLRRLETMGGLEENVFTSNILSLVENEGN